MSRADDIAQEIHRFCTTNRARHSWAVHLPEAHAVDALTKTWVDAAVKLIHTNIAGEVRALHQRTAHEQALATIAQTDAREAKAERDHYRQQLELAAISRYWLAKELTPDLH